MPHNRHPVAAKPSSQVLHVLHFLSAKPAAASLVAAASAAVLTSAAISSRTDGILSWYEAIAGAITLVMVFVLQHTQTRQQVALQLKLDAVLHALPEADNRLISLESASDRDIMAAEARHSDLLDHPHA